MDDIIKTIELLQKSGLLTNGASETAKQEIKKIISWGYDGTSGCFIDNN